MTVLNKVKHTAERVIGGIKEKTGVALNNPQLEDRGRARRLAGKVKSAGDTVVSRARRLRRNKKA